MSENFKLKNVNGILRSSAFKIALIYLIIGGLWILLSDNLLTWLVSDPVLQYQLQTPKGWFFILVTGIILYFLIRRDTRIAEELYEKEYQSRLSAEDTRIKFEGSEARYRMLIEQASDGIFLIDKDGKYLDMNESGFKMLGFSKNELLGMKLSDTIDAENLISDPIRWDELNSGKIVITERVMNKKDGNKIFVETSKRQLPDGSVQGIMRDITERKRNENILTESEKRYRNLFMSNPNPMWVYDLETLAFLDVNEAAIKNYSYNRNEFLAMTIKDIRPDEDVKKLLLNIEAAVYGFEYSTGWKHLKKDGSIIHVEIRSSAIEYHGRKAKLVSAIDVTSKKKAEDELKASNEKLKAFFDSNLIGIIFGDIYGGVFEANDEYLRIIGYTREDLKNGLVRWDKITPQEYLTLDEERIREVQMKGVCTPYEKKYIRKDGSLVWVFVGYILVGDKREKSVAYILDITQLKEAELKQNKLREEKDELLRMLQLQINRMPFGYILFNEKLEIDFWNPAAENIFGYSRDEVTGKTPYGLILKEENRKYIEKLREEWLKGNTSAHSINGNLTKDGRTIMCEWINTPLLDEKGKFKQLLSMVQDITDRIKSDEEIKKQREELRSLASHLQSIREKERIAISRELHDELGQILTSIKMNMTLLGKELSNKLDGIDLTYFINEINSMSSLLDRSVKSVRKIISDLRPEVLVNLDLIDAIEWQVSEFNRLPGTKCIFTYKGNKRDFEDEFTTAVFRIIQEALTNVRRHSFAKNVIIELETDKENFILSVKDDGVGIKDLQNIKRKSFGLLGIRERAILLGGNLEIKSSAGKGTELIVSASLDKMR